MQKFLQKIKKHQQFIDSKLDVEEISKHRHNRLMNFNRMIELELIDFVSQLEVIDKKADAVTSTSK